ncbi:MAG: hypothetical protein WBL39_15300, partial [Terrimicrobiaceae bacterium]
KERCKKDGEKLPRTIGKYAPLHLLGSLPRLSQVANPKIPARPCIIARLQVSNEAYYAVLHDDLQSHFQAILPVIW